MVSSTAMEEVARAALNAAKKEIEELGELFIEDQFRHIVVSELNKKSTINGNFKAGNSYPKIVLEFMWKKGGKKMDIAILKSSTKGNKDRYSYKKDDPQPLAIELKVSSSKKAIAKDVSRVRKFLSPGGKSTFKNGMVLVGSRTKYRPQPKNISTTKTGFLFGCIAENGTDLVIEWLKRPEDSKKTTKKKKTTKRNASANKKSTSQTQLKCKAIRKRDGKRCQDPVAANRKKYCSYHSKKKNRKK